MTYKIFDEKSAIKHMIEDLGYFDNSADLTCKEIGDGNLNHVFRIVDKISKQSFILKQALPYARTSKDMTLDANRCKIEAMTLIAQSKYSPQMVPKVFNYDENLYAMVMEDLTGHIILRTAMMQQKIYPNLAKDAACFFANSLIRSSDIVLESKQKKGEVARFINVDLCDLTEKLVLTSPTYNDPRKRVETHLKEFEKDEILNNEDVIVAFAKLKHNFMTNSQALLHGDAHTGSIFVSENSTKFFDAEFGFYGPMGFDTGLFLGNLLMNAVYQKVTGFDVYYDWVINLIGEFVDQFTTQFNAVWDTYGLEHYAKNSEVFKSFYLSQVLEDTAGYCACEMIRRTTGSSHVAEMDEYSDKTKHEKAQKVNILLAKEILLNQTSYVAGLDYKELLEQVL
ncbi:MAG: S-methyl-5-thioribose kinase [Chloroflexi bacterium]|nr:S-methyl-5-thioribose kinase [Chloroflexota bacterium]